MVPVRGRSPGSACPSPGWLREMACPCWGRDQGSVVRSLAASTCAQVHSLAGVPCRVSWPRKEHRGTRIYLFFIF